MDNNQIEELFDDIDLFDNDEVEWQEFVAAAMGLKIQLQKKNLKWAFTQIDRNGAGQISRQEIVDAFGKEKFDQVKKDNAEMLWQEFISEIGIEKERDSISFDEFSAAMSTAVKTSGRKFSALDAPDNSQPAYGNQLVVPN